jgi:hypothetical protein
MKFINELFLNQVKLESYLQNYNVTNPFYDSEQKTEVNILLYLQIFKNKYPIINEFILFYTKAL